MAQKKKRAAGDLSEIEKAILAAIFTHINIGHGMPDPDDVQYLRRIKCDDYNTAVAQICGRYWENDKHEMVYTDECAAWYKELAEKTRADIERYHPDIFAAMWTS